MGSTSYTTKTFVVFLSSLTWLWFHSLDISRSHDLNIHWTILALFYYCKDLPLLGPLCILPNLAFMHLPNSSLTSSVSHLITVHHHIGNAYIACEHASNMPCPYHTLCSSLLTSISHECDLPRSLWPSQDLAQPELKPFSKLILKVLLQIFGIWLSLVVH